MSDFRFALIHASTKMHLPDQEWQTWEEAQTAFPIPVGWYLVDFDTGRHWRHGYKPEWEAADTPLTWSTS